MCALPTQKTHLKKGDIVRLKASDGCLIGDYYVVVDASDRRVTYLKKIISGRLQENKEYILDKEKLGVVPVVKFKTDVSVIESLFVNRPQCLRLDYNKIAVKNLQLFQEANKTNPISVALLYGNDYEDRIFIKFVSMMKTTKVVEHLGTKCAIPHLTLFNIGVC